MSTTPSVKKSKMSNQIVKEHVDCKNTLSCLITLFQAALKVVPIIKTSIPNLTSEKLELNPHIQVSLLPTCKRR